MTKLPPPPPAPSPGSNGGFSDPAWQRWFSQLNSVVSQYLVTYVAGANVISFNTRQGNITLLTGDVSGALGFTPYSAANPAGYITPAGAPVQSVAGHTGAVVLVKGDVGLGSVDNTADASKPVSSAQAAELLLKADSTDLLLKADISGLRVVEGSNAKQGIVTLVAGIATVANTSITASSRVFLTSQSDGGSPGYLRVTARTAGVSFTVTSGSLLDTSVVAYEIFEPA